MIQIVEQPDAVLVKEIRRYLSAVNANPEHDPRWLEVLRDGLGHHTFMLIARSGSSTADDPAQNRQAGVDRGAICGYLPLALVASRLFGKFLVSLPYLNRAGVVAQDESTGRRLVDSAVGIARQHDVKYLELRDDGPVSPHPDLAVGRSDKVRMVLPLPSSADALWASVGPKVRNQVRKGDKNDLSIDWGGAELLDDFYSVFAVNMRDLGTPVYSKRLFASIIERFDGQAELAVVRCGNQPAATAVLVHSGRSTQVPSASSLRSFNRTNANMWMYHRLIGRAIDRGSGEFDFGRSSLDSGTYRFKKQWGGMPQPTQWRYHLRYGDIAAMRPDSPRNRRRVAVWKKLPVWLTQQVGPLIVRGIP